MFTSLLRARTATTYEHCIRYYCAFSSIKTQRIKKKSMTVPTDVAIQVEARFVAEDEWRNKAAVHKARIETLLSPGLIGREDNDSDIKIGRSLDRLHPIYNFLIEYYGIKGSKGVNRLLRWCPGQYYHNNRSDDDVKIQLNVSITLDADNEMKEPKSLIAGVFLENASTEDINSGMLHLRGATIINSDDIRNINGILYSPQLYLGTKDVDILFDMEAESSRIPHKAAVAFIWYRTLLTNTLKSDPILYCNGEFSTTCISYITLFPT